MKSSKKFGAVLGALALAASLGLTAAPAEAAIDPDIIVSPATVVGDVYVVDGPTVTITYDATVCAAGDQVVPLVRSVESGLVYDWAMYPGGEVAEAWFDAPFSGDFQAGYLCTDYAGSGVTGVGAWSDFTVAKGYVMMAGPGGSNTWATDQEVTLTSDQFAGYYLDEGVTGSMNAFDANSPVTITVTGPDGTVWTFNATADANGMLTYTTVLPFTVEGVYEVSVTGTRGGVAVELINAYAPADPVAPQPTTPTTPADPPAGKPTALPKTGSEGVNLISAAALISVVAGGAAVALRSRKH